MGEDNDTLLNRKRDSVWACVYVCVGGGGKTTTSTNYNGEGMNYIVFQNCRNWFVSQSLS